MNSHSQQVFLDRKQSRMVDEIAINQFGIPGVVLMENAGRNSAEVIAKHHPDKHMLIACGPGNNGGDGFVIARYLSIYGISCEILLVPSPDELKGDARIHFEPLIKMNLPVVLFEKLNEEQLISHIKKAEVVIDSLLGTGLECPVREQMHFLIEKINRHSQYTIAIDLPSGLDAVTGMPHGIAVKSDMTLTMVSPKTGFRHSQAKDYLGEVVVIPIGIPFEVIDLAMNDK